MKKLFTMLSMSVLAQPLFAQPTGVPSALVSVLNKNGSMIIEGFVCLSGNRVPTIVFYDSTNPKKQIPLGKRTPYLTQKKDYVAACGGTLAYRITEKFPQQKEGTVITAIATGITNPYYVGNSGMRVKNDAISYEKVYEVIQDFAQVNGVLIDQTNRFQEGLKTQLSQKRAELDKLIEATQVQVDALVAKVQRNSELGQNTAQDKKDAAALKAAQNRLAVLQSNASKLEKLAGEL